MNYFSTPLPLGFGAYAKPEFPTPESLLRHLDYLGIDRALVYNITAQDYSPIVGNRELLRMIEGCGERLKPAFVITPSDYFEHGTLEWLLDQAVRGNRCYVLRPKMSRFPLRQIERLLAELCKYSPVFFADYRENMTPEDYRDMEYLALKYPDARFVICRQMWTTFGAVVDLMLRCENFGVDISCLQMIDAIELVIREFGVERLFFGIGHTSQYGAAPGALSHAQITEEEREKIAHSNLERLLGLPALSGKLAREPDFADKPLWDTFRRGKPLSTVRVIDAHTHLAGPNTRGWILPEPEPSEGMASMVRFMDRHGVDRAVLIANRALFSDLLRGNREAEELAAGYPGRFWGYFVFNPWHDDEVNTAVLDNFFSREYFVGFKLLPSYWKVPIDDRRYTIVYEYAERHHLPILIHTWGDAAPLAELAPRYPHAKFIAGHSGGSNAGRNEIEEIARRSPNVYFEFCATFCSTVPWHETMSRFDNSRFIFGSDTALHNEAYELSALLSMPVPDAMLVPVLAENFERILKERR